jgi:hypothetical protein
MGQAVLLITQLLIHGLLQINELDPIRRFMPSYDRTRKIGRYSVFQVIKNEILSKLNKGCGILAFLLFKKSCNTICSVFLSALSVFINAFLHLSIAGSVGQGIRK